MGAAPHIQLLGPVRLVYGDAVVDPGGDVRRALLALLALHAGTAVGDDDIRVGLWGDAPPAGAVASVRSHLSRLRRSAPGLQVHRTTGGYVLDVRADDVDALTARAALDSARPQTPEVSLATIEGALARWHGPALSDVRRFPFAAPAIAELAGLRADLIRARVDRWLSLDHDPAAAVTWLKELEVEAAGDERTAQLRMLALYRAGRQREALEVFQQLRAHLRADAGLDPSATTCAVHQRILSQDASLLHGPVQLTASGAGPAPVRAPVVPDAGTGVGRALAPPPLPVPLSSFVGREAELRDVRTAMDAARLVTITGAGGTGKTRLALEALRRVTRLDLDGPWVVSLADIDDAALVASAVAQSLGVATGAQSALDAVTAAVADRPALLLVDNCEHLIDVVAGHLADLLGRCPFVRVLATSREPLALPGERVIALDPLPTGGDAVDLFADRAVAADHTFVLDDATRPGVERLCAALDGIPLAIELAAGRMQTLSLEQILDLLTDRFALLTGTHRGGPARHRTLAAAIEWSTSLLEDTELEVLLAAAAFTGTFSLDALATVSGRSVGELVIPLSSLVSKSMVTVATRAGARRYRLLDTVREYVRHQAGPPQVRVMADRHAAWAAATADESYEAARSTPTWMSVLRAEQPNLRAALEHTLIHAPATAVRLAGALSWFWYRRGHAAEGLAWLERSLTSAPEAPAALRSRALGGVAILRYLAGQTGPARTAAQEALAAAEAAGDQVLQATAIMCRAYLDATVGDVAGAAQLLDRTDAETLPTWIRAEHAMVTGQLRRAGGDLTGALDALEEAADLAERCGHTWAWGSARWLTGKALLDGGRGDEAARVLMEVVDRFVVDGDRTSALAGLHVLAATAAQQGRLLDGATLFGAVDALGQRIGYHPSRMDPLDGPRHRAAVLHQIPDRLATQAMARGAALSLPQALALARSLTEVTPSVT